MKLVLIGGWVAALLCLSALAEEKQNAVYAAHEWGTFTSVQGEDGVQLEWNPYVVAELPGFVYDRNRPNHEANRGNFALFAAKTGFMARQRMETPVIYFYSPEKKTVDVHVDFPSGLMTEWYPHATSCDAQRTANEKPGAKKVSYLEWNKVTIEPTASSEKLIVDGGKSHYYAARETDASILKIPASEKSGAETEKFLFYRGVGHFDAPLNVKLDDNGKLLKMENAGKEALKNLFLVNVENTAKGRVFRTMAIEKIDARGKSDVAIDSAKAGTRDELIRDLQTALESEGLYAAEAKAMIKTWEDSWFDETGVRVLYVLGRNWTDEILPLTIAPKPEQIARVMIGRAEVITPQMEIALRDSIVEYWKGDASAQEKAVSKARNIGLGRFTDAAVRRIVKKNPGQEFSKAAFELAGKSSQPAQAGPVAAATMKEEDQNLLTSISTR
jgi:hypothetical protein